MAKPRPDEERQLYVGLDADELRLKGDKQSTVVKEIESLARLEVLKKQEAKNLSDRQKELSQNVALMADDILNRREIRFVRCSWRRTTERWECFRTDTGEVVDSAPITMADQQEELRLS